MAGTKLPILGLASIVASTAGAACSTGPSAENPEASASSSAPPPTPEPPPGPPEPEPAETGHACAKATSLCDGGSCTVKLKNDCAAPLTCEASVLLRCKTPTESVEARGRGRQTFPVKTENEMVVSGNCTMGNLVYTALSDLQCK